jgi:hypothetical protein
MYFSIGRFWAAFKEAKADQVCYIGQPNYGNVHYHI